MWLLSAHQGHILVCGLAQNLTTNVCQHNIQRGLSVGFQTSHRNIFYETCSSHQEVIPNNFKRTSLPIFFKTCQIHVPVLLWEEIYIYIYIFSFSDKQSSTSYSGCFFFRSLRRQAFHVPFSSLPHRPSPPLLPRFSLAFKIAPEAIRILNEGSYK